MSLGWQCPACGAVYAPHITSCHQSHTIMAASGNITAATVSVDVGSSKASKSSKPRAKHTYTSEFELFWGGYPLKVGKYPSSRNFAAAVAAGADADAIVAAAVRYASHVERNPQLSVKHPEGWLTDERWNDELPPSLEEASARKAQEEIERTRRFLDGDEEAR